MNDYRDLVLDPALTIFAHLIAYLKQSEYYLQKSLFFENCHLNNIYIVNELIDDNGQFYSFSEFSRKFEFVASLNMYISIIL